MTTTTVRTKLSTEELTFPRFVPKIEKSLLAQPGVTKAEVKFSSGRIEVEHDPALSDVAALVHSVAKVGYAAKPSAF
jgi:copper chaperone CopZ